MKRKLKALALTPILILLGCAAAPGPTSHVERLLELNEQLDLAEAEWTSSIDDPCTEPELTKAYREMQWLCRRLHRRKEGFETTEEQRLCKRVEFPYTIYFNKLKVETNRLREQLFEIEKEGTVANEYMRRPSRENELKLRALFDQVHRYYVGKPYSWHRYYNKFLFQRSRMDHFRGELEERDLEYMRAKASGAPEEEIALARKRAEFAYERLKEEYIENDLPFAGEVGAFYRSRDLDDYHEKVLEERKKYERRKELGLKKEVVIFVHGLGQGRRCWGGFSTLLADDDLSDPETDRYFKVYVFSYDTVEDSKSVEGFKNELAGFIDDIRKIEEVAKVNLIGHSFGGVLCLKYLVNTLDCPRVNEKRWSPESAGKVLDCYLDGVFRQKVKRFIGIAPALSGSEVANINAGVFLRKKDLYRKRVPFLRGGIPFAGDIQVVELEIGSAVNLNSFERLDTERILDPLTLAGWAPDYELTSEQRALLASDEIKVLDIIGNPWYWTKLGRIENDNYLSPYSVESYSANINHSFLIDEDGRCDIGYQGAESRYTGNNHFKIIDVKSRKHPSYRYTVSFLKDELIPQIRDGSSRIRRCMTILRFFPSVIDKNRYTDVNFLSHPVVYYLPDRKLTLPEIHIDPVMGEDLTKNVKLAAGKWNDITGAFFQEGTVIDPREAAWVTYELSAEGYKTKRVKIPVRGGQVTYAPCITLKEASDDDM